MCGASSFLRFFFLLSPLLLTFSEIPPEIPAASGMHNAHPSAIRAEFVQIAARRVARPRRAAAGNKARMRRQRESTKFFFAHQSDPSLSSVIKQCSAVKLSLSDSSHVNLAG